MYEEFMMDDAEICIVAFGLSSRISKNAIIAATITTIITIVATDIFIICLGFYAL